MKSRFWLALACLAAVAAAPAANSVFAEIAAKLQGPLKDLDVLDQQDKDLKASEDAQIFSSEAEKKQRSRIEDDAKQLIADANHADEVRQSLIDSGCPPEGGEVAAELAARCNPQIDAHRALVQQLTQRMNSLEVQGAQVNELRDNIKATVLANVEKRKQITADRERLTAERDQLQLLAVEEVLKRGKLHAASVCTSECCHRVIYDGADPKVCGVGLICQSFQGGGLFGRAVICGAGPSQTPIREAVAPASAAPVAKPKRQWEIDYDQKMAAYQQELAKQQQAVAQYQHDLVEMQQRRAGLKDDAARAQANWERRVAACKAGNYAECARQ